MLLRRQTLQSRVRASCCGPCSPTRLGGAAEYIVIPAPCAGGGAHRLRDLRRAVRQEPARPLFLHVPGRLRHLVLLAEHADPRSAAHPHGAVHGAAGAARPRDHRRRGRAADGGAGRNLDRAAAAGCASAGRANGNGARRHDRRRRLDRVVGRPAALPRRQRNHLQPAAGLYRARAAQSSGRGADARSGEPEQAVDERDRRRQHDRDHSRHRRALGPGVRHRRRDPGLPA